MKYFLIFTIAILFAVQNTQAQGIKIKELVKTPKVASSGLAPFRNEFISYNIRKFADQGDRTKTEHYKVLKMVPQILDDGSTQLITNVDVPYMWLDRDVFIQVKGVAAFTISINNEDVGYSSDSRCPSQFNISDYITDGSNEVKINTIENGFGAQMDGTYISNEPYEVFVYSQPKLRIEDYKITTLPDTTNKNTIFKINIGLANSYNSTDIISAGYDIYSPNGKLLNFDMKEVELEANGRDTISFNYIEYNSKSMLWSEKSPSLYKVMLFVKYNGRLIEYIPLKIGISNITYKEDVIYRNGAPIEITPTNYNAAATKTETVSELKSIKKRGFNSVIVNYPQDWWFYDLCDEMGVNVIDQANINNTINASNRDINGSIGNNPEWTKHFTERAARTIKRNSNRASIIAISLGGNVGNGYNLYKSYQEAKIIEKTRPIILRDHEGEWNSDMSLPN